MSKQKGFAVISGSSSVVAKIMENGQVVFGQDKAVNMRVSGTLVLDLPPDGIAENGRVVLVDSVGSASLGKLDASNVVVDPAVLGGSDVQTVLESLSTEVSTAQLNSTDGLSIETFLRESVDEVLSTSLSTSVYSLDDRIDTLLGSEDNGLSGALSTLIQIQDFLNGDGSGAVELAGGISDLTSAVSGLSVTVNTLSADTSTALSTEVSTLGADIDSLSTNVSTNLSTEVSVIGADIDSLSTNVSTNLSTEVSVIGADIDSLSTNVSTNLSTEVSTLGADIDSLSTNVSTNLSTEVSVLSADIDDLSTNVSTNLSTEVSVLSADIDNLSTNVSTNLSTEVSVLSADIDSLSTNVSTNLSTEVSVLSADIDSLSTNVSTNLSTEISSLSTDVSSRIDGLSITAVANETSVSKVGDVFTVGLASDVSIASSLTVGGLASFKGADNILDAAIDGTLLTDMSGDPASYNGRFFYLKATNHAAAQAVGFDQANKWYFCEGDEWFASPFYGV